MNPEAIPSLSFKTSQELLNAINADSRLKKYHSYLTNEGVFISGTEDFDEDRYLNFYSALVEYADASEIVIHSDPRSPEAKKEEEKKERAKQKMVDILP